MGYMRELLACLKLNKKRKVRAGGSFELQAKPGQSLYIIKSAKHLPLYP